MQARYIESSGLSDKVDVEFTNKGVQITYYNFEVTCDFTAVNVTHTFENGVLNIAQQGFPKQANCICYTDVSYTIGEISQNEVNVIFINGLQVYCHNDKEDNQGDADFCSCLNLKDINKTIPIVNEFLAGLPNGISKEQTFESLETWLNSFSCNVDARILIGKDMDWGYDVMYGVAISVKDDKIIRELQLDFAIINNALTYSQIAGYIYTKQDAIQVATKYTKMDDLFNFINSLEFDVQEIKYGTFISSMPSDSTNLNNITNILKAKPYTRDSWVVGHLNWYLPGITFFVNLYDMHNRDYQADWIKTMNKYKLVEYDYPDNKESVIDGIVYGPGDIVVFMIPEGTGKQWETKFMEYDFVRWTQMDYTQYTIR